MMDATQTSWIEARGGRRRPAQRRAPETPTPSCAWLRATPEAAEEPAPPRPAGSVDRARLRGLLDIVRRVAHGVHARAHGAVAFDELYAAGSLGLAEALSRWDEQRQESFDAYAERRIRGAIQDELRKLDHLSRKSRHDARRMEKARQAVVDQGGGLTKENMAGEMGVNLAEFYHMERRIADRRFESLDGLLEANLDPTGWAQSAERDRMDFEPQRGMLEREERAVLHEEWRALPEDSQRALDLRFQCGLKFREIAAELRVSEARAFRLTQDALSQLRKRCGQRLGDLAAA